MSDSSPEPTATGTLARTPLSHLIVYCLDRSLSGTLVLQTPDGARHAILFAKGQPAKVRTSEPVHALGKLLVGLNIVPLPDVEEALGVALPQRIPLGQVLVSAGKLDNGALLQLLAQQTMGKLVYLFSLTAETVYGFYEGKNFLESWGGPELFPVDVLPLIWAGVKAYPNMANVDALLTSLGDRPIKLHIDGDFKRFNVTDRAKGVIDYLKAKPSTLAQLFDAGIAPERDIRLLIYTFLLCRHIDLGTGQNPVGVVVSTDSTPISDTATSGRAAVARVRLKPMARPRSIPAVEIGPDKPGSHTPKNPPATGIAGLFADVGLAPELLERQDEIAKRAAEIDKEDFFTVLGLAPEAPATAARDAYFALAKKWHPDKLPEGLASSRDDAAKVFARMNEAFQTLTDNDKRAIYIEAFKKGAVDPEEQAQVARVLEAQFEYQKAEILFKKNDHDGARKLLQRAVEKDPEQPDYQCLLAWLKALPASTHPDVIDESIKALNAVLERDFKHQRSIWYRGQLLKRLGREKQAIADFRRLLELDPKHIDAQREVRIYEMRHRDGSEAPKTESGEEGEKQAGGLFGKLLKR